MTITLLKNQPSVFVVETHSALYQQGNNILSTAPHRTAPHPTAQYCTVLYYQDKPSNTSVRLRFDKNRICN
jgi:hypothetical protein